MAEFGCSSWQLFGNKDLMTEVGLEIQRDLCLDPGFNLNVFHTRAVTHAVQPKTRPTIQARLKLPEDS